MNNDKVTIEFINGSEGKSLLINEYRIAGSTKSWVGKIVEHTWLVANKKDILKAIGIQGEFYPNKPDIFAKTYEKETLEDQDEECGYWIKEYLNYGACRYKCSECGGLFGEDVIDEFNHNKYCADCGAKMKLR